MDVQEFRIKGKEMVDYICEYLEKLPTRRVTPNIEPGYLKYLISPEAPEDPEPWENIMKDVENKIMPGVTHWQHPRFHAYFPSGNSFPSILGDMLSAGIGCIGFSWAASPACTELETIVVDWFGKAIGLPKEFLALEEGSKGGGVIQTSASECILVCMLAARAQAIKVLKQQYPNEEEGALLSKLMAYCSRESHSCVEKAAMISFVKLRILNTDDKYRLRGETLKKAIEEDVQSGLMPFFVSTTLGTTSCCSFDKLNEIGPVCKEYPHVWLHVDAAYAGNAFICPELKPLLEGIEYASSFNTNPNKFLLTNYDCSTMWVRDRISLTSALVVDPLYLQHGYSDATIDYRHWGVPLSRRFRSLKLWFVLRSYGIKGIQDYIRHHIRLAKKFESLVLRDQRFEVCNEVKLGLVCFRLKGSNGLNEKLLSAINASGKIHMVPASLNDTYVIRFCVVAQNATDEDIDYAWKVITEFSEELLESQALEKEPIDEVSEMLLRKKKETLAYKRSFFVRMVSDPKIYNPKITKSLSMLKAQNSESNSIVSINPPIASWISWPLAFLLQGKFEDSNEVPVRFRHLNTMVHLKTRRESNVSDKSPEDNEDQKSKLINMNHTLKRSPKKSPILGMESKEFRIHGKEMVDFICEYLENISKQRVISPVEPGYLAPLMPKEAPIKGEEWNKIMNDVEEKILPGITHWQHPRFHAYFPSGNSFTSILADMLSDAIGCIGFSWAASPACTELETIVLDWLGKALNLPSEFIFSAPGSIGGGVIQPSASDCILVCMLAARAQAINYLKKLNGTPDEEDGVFLPKLVAYCSREAHSCVEKAAMISLVKLRIVEADEKCCLRGAQLKKVIEEDISNGLHPFFISATLGTTSSCAFDNLMEIGPIAKELPACWFHADGAYAGSGFICPELRYLMEGMHYVDSFNTNCNKWLMVCFDCSCLWVKDRLKLTNAMVVDPLYLQHENSKLTIDYRHWGIPLSRRFRSLKLWFTLRSYGVEGLQKYIRNHCKLAKEFEKLVRNDERFEVCNEVKVGLVCFRLIGTNTLNQELLASINSSGQLHMIPSMIKGKYVIRFCVVNQHATHDDIVNAWNIIQTHGTKILAATQTAYIPSKDLRSKKLTRRFSFTRSVSRDLYERRNSRNSLHDGATPIAVLEDDVNCDDMEDVFEQSVTINNEKNSNNYK